MGTNQMSGRGLRTLDEIRVGVVTINITVDTEESSLSPAEASTVRQVNEMLDESRARVVQLEEELARQHAGGGVYDDRYKLSVELDESRAKVRQLEEKLAEAERLLQPVGNVHALLDETETKLRESRELVDFKSRVIDELADELADERNRLTNELDLVRKQARRAQDAVNGRDLALEELATQRQRNAELKDRLAVADDSRTEMNQHRVEAWKRAAEATHRLDQIQKIVSRQSVIDGTADPNPADWIDYLTKAIRDIRDVLSASPDTETSQA